MFGTSRPWADQNVDTGYKGKVLPTRMHVTGWSYLHMERSLGIPTIAPPDGWWKAANPGVCPIIHPDHSRALFCDIQVIYE